MTYLYLFWDHDEHGPENLEATLNRNLVMTLFEEYWDVPCGWDDKKKFKEHHTDIYEKDKSQLLSLLEKPDENLCGVHSLGSGWGGLHFQVVKLRVDDGK